MCGIAGYCLKANIRPSVDQIDGLLRSIRKRGPDDEGICLISRRENIHRFYKTDHTHPGLAAQLPYMEKDNTLGGHDVAFIHSRYAILDLSQKGHQPFFSRDGCIIAIFNGEIYNYLELRKELLSQGVELRTNCDTEVLVEGYALWKDALWPKMNGFWAVVLYDRTTGAVVLCRDRIGVAPLYYRQTSEGLFFSSYIEPLIDINGEKAVPDEGAVLGFVQTGLKDIDYGTHYAQIKTLPAATAVHLSPSQYVLPQAPHKQYWHLPDSMLTEHDISFADAVKKFRGLFFDAVDLRLRADVKVAFELSGGLDSSAVVAAAACLQKNKITTYTAKIRGADEEPFARSLLQKYPLDYHVLSNIENSFAEDYGPFSKLMEEPYDNPNDYTHYQMLKAMKAQGVQVVVTGAGGDEVFAGYESSFWPKASQEWRAQGMGALLKADWYEFCRRFKTWKNSYNTLRHYCVDPWKYIMGTRPSKAPGEEIPTAALTYQGQYPKLSFARQRRFHFLVALLPYYMRSSDHFTMGIPIEHRFPLLDYRLVEFGLQLPVSYLFRNGWTKYILRKAMEPYLPAKIVWRRQKMGFQFPYRRYFQEHQRVFKPLLHKSDGSFVPACNAGSYEDLLKNDPLLLWRLVSTAIWMEHNVKGAHV